MNDEIASLLTALLEIGAVEIYIARFVHGTYTVVVLRTDTTRVSSAKGTGAQALRAALSTALRREQQ